MAKVSERISSRSWLVEYQRDHFDEVYADNVEVVSGGALRFSDGALGQHTVTLIAPGQWISVVPGEE